MTFRLPILIALLSSAPLAADEAVDVIQGNWLGTWDGKDGMGGKNVAQIYGLGRGEYQAIFTAYDSGEQDKGEFTFAIRGAATPMNEVVFDQELDLGGYGKFKFHAKIANSRMKGTYSNGNQFEGVIDLKRINTKPDAVGIKPLPGAKVLFNGESLDGWEALGDDPPDWKVVKGVIVAPQSERLSPPKSGHLACLEKFGHAQLHVEFRVPYLPKKRGENRGQSGVILFGRHEVQIVDSFGFPRAKDVQGFFIDTDAVGALYGRQAPTELPALPPGEWQAFDITVKPAVLDESGKIFQPGELTMQLNGTTIHAQVPLEKPTVGAPFAKGSDAPALMLQHTGQPVEFRNIWMVPLDRAAE